ncbi:Response regulator MprA [Aliarcobacter thereius]|uniref:Response regulator MprA n=1 Tax=Aliarcobacter thereius TaxID=544718 RepID=A0A1C0B525_9BACT|nr:response regulator [Aliarcobacter thereius]OCL87886.1 Response regulator MprA [Aliarcobacter thereius]OCL97556.1 Response regulator MprA [Aliarcobacter thereius]
MSINEFKNIKILFVDDEKNIRLNAVSYLERLFDEVYEAENVLGAFEIIKDKKPHIIITDINMPQINGLEMIRKIRQIDNEIKIIVLSAYTKTDYLLEAIELRLEKYLVKPIHHDILFPVLKSCVSKLKSHNSNIKYFSEECYFDTFEKILYKDNDSIKLTNKELDFLSLLCENSNNLVHYDTIQAVIWSDSFMTDDSLKTVVRKLRQKLPKNCLENFSKLGYKIITI